jgi:hypothetical protein
MNGEIDLSPWLATAVLGLFIIGVAMYIIIEGVELYKKEKRKNALQRKKRK